MRYAMDYVMNENERTWMMLMMMRMTMREEETHVLMFSVVSHSVLLYFIKFFSSPSPSSSFVVFFVCEILNEYG